MNSRTRFLETLTYGQVDRVPLFDEGIRSEVISTWNREGLPLGVPLSSIIMVDPREELYLDVDLKPAPAIWPTDRSLLDMLEQRLDPNDPTRLPTGWPERVESWNRRDYVLMVRLNDGFFQTLGVQGWDRFEEIVILAKDQPDLVREALLLHGTFTAQLLDRLLATVEVDAAVFSEPIAGNHGSLISPAMYEDLVIAGYQPILSMLEQHNVKNIVMRTYANPRDLLPSMVNAGINCLWACEAPPDSMDYRKIRQEFGRELRLIGGIDVDLLSGNPDSLSKNLFTTLPPLLADGGFIPLADGRVRRYIPFDNYITYRKLLEQVVSSQ